MESQSNDEAARPRHSILGPAVTALVVLPLLYVAGLGPAVWIADRAPVVEPLIATAYAPLERVAERHPRLADALFRYASWWAPLPGANPKFEEVRDALQ